MVTNSEIFKPMISMAIRLKDVSVNLFLWTLVLQVPAFAVVNSNLLSASFSYCGQFTFAYDLLKDMELLNLQPTPAMYNSIMVGYFREVS